MKILIAFDSFKGSLSSQRAGELLEEGLKNTNPDSISSIISVADGGEGSLEMIKENKQKHSFTASDPLGRSIKAYFLSYESTAYIEMAITSGLTLLKEEEKNPLKTTTFGLGEQILKAIESGFKRIIIFAGGSATNDAGLGALKALGFKFYSKDKTEILPRGETLHQITSFDAPDSKNFPEIWVATDVTNPLYGPTGATYVYAPQKGASPEMLSLLESGIKNITALFLEKEINKLRGSGAAGGLAGGFNLFLGAKVISASEVLFADVNLKEKVENADLVITGEGRLDSQSLNGKLVSKITDLCQSKKCIIVAGEVEKNLFIKNALHVSALKKPKMSTEEAILNAENLMRKKGEEIGNFLKNKFV